MQDSTSNDSTETNRVRSKKLLTCRINIPRLYESAKVEHLLFTGRVSMRRHNAQMRESLLTRLVHGVHDRTLNAQIIGRRPLSYSLGADAQLDRPAHVRAASGVNWLGGKLAIVQDDASFLALVDPHGSSVQAVALPSGKLGLRQFDKSRGNKLDKPDFEACFVVEETLYALGSGSHAQRERIASIASADWAVREHSTPELFAALRDCVHFAGSELNVEGALVLGAQLRLFQRGNGAARAGREPINATCDLSLAQLLDYLAGARQVPVPERVVRYEIGRIADVALTFTDAALHPAGVVFLACAEASEDAIQDGEIMGSAVGMFDDTGLRWGFLLDETGNPSRDKAEGIVIDPSAAERAYVVVDPDDHRRPAELLTVALGGALRHRTSGQ
jgi:hypothetical protein